MKVRNTILAFTKRYYNHYAISNTRRVAGAVPFEGAFVFPIENTLNRTHPVSVLDFASLYPNIIISCNLSPEKVVLPEQKHIMRALDAGEHIVRPQTLPMEGFVLWHGNKE
jgi:DNA polymerase elongation subunit (family B)